MQNNSTCKKHLVCSIFLLLLCCGTVWSQTVSGVVTDSLGTALPGTSVIIKGTAIGTTTDVNGAYTLSADNYLPAGSIIVFSFIGFKTREVEYNDQTKLDIQLQEDRATLSEVVVTALGIKREEKELGFATQKLDAEQVSNAQPNNWAASLSGKVAGLRMISSGSGPLNSTKITLRGDNSLSPDGNFALVVLDGVPMPTSMSSSGVSSAYGAGAGNDVPVDFGNGIADINPDDIESINVLKGAAATALYGSRAANGALIITTKSGARKNKGLGITINSNYSINDILKWPDLQYEYGQGPGGAVNADGELYYSYGASADGANTGSTSSAFGPRFNGQMFFQYDPTVEGQSAERQPWRPYKNNVKGLSRTGFTFTNNVSLDGGNDKNSVRASITHTKNEWIIPNAGFERIVAALSLSNKISDKLKINAKVNYTNKKSDNLPATGYNNQSLPYFMIFQNPNIDLKWYEPRWKKGKEQIEQLHPFSSFIDNPYLIAYEMTNAVNAHTIVGNLSFTYEVSKKFDVMVRSAINLNQEKREQRRPYNLANYKKGFFKIQHINFREINSDVMLTYKDKLSDNIDVRVMVGANQMKQDLNEVSTQVDGLVAPAVYSLANGMSYPQIIPVDRDKIINSVLGLATFSYHDMIFLDVSGRNDWSSTLPLQNNSYFYPSVSTSIVLSEIFNMPRPLSFSKLRLAVSGVVNDTLPYKAD
jgi:TonB-linked SusC/RagA family outer membrane protein